MTGLPAIGCANSADLHEIQMEKTIAIAIRSVDRWVSFRASNYVRGSLPWCLVKLNISLCIPLYPTYKTSV